MTFRFYMNNTGGKTYLQLWRTSKKDKRTIKEKCVSLGTPEKLVNMIMDENKTKELRERFTKLLKEE